MTNDDSKIRNEKTNAVIGVLLIQLVLVLFGAGFWWVFAEERRMEEALKPTAETTLLPIVAGPFKQDRFLVYEFEHGWLVWTADGLSFVPKPPKQE